MSIPTYVFLLSCRFRCSEQLALCRKLSVPSGNGLLQAYLSALVSFCRKLLLWPYKCQQPRLVDHFSYVGAGHCIHTFLSLFSSHRSIDTCVDSEIAVCARVSLCMTSCLRMRSSLLFLLSLVAATVAPFSFSCLGVQLPPMRAILHRGRLKPNTIESLYSDSLWCWSSSVWSVLQTL